MNWTELNDSNNTMRFLGGETGFRHPRIQVSVIDWVFSTQTSEQEEMFMDVCSILFLFFLYICLCIYLQIQFWAVVYLW